MAERLQLAQQIQENLRELTAGQAACEAFLADELSALAEAAPLHPELAADLLLSTTTEFEAGFLEDMDDSRTAPGTDRTAAGAPPVLP
eukprot:1194498-Prorocentrum_minimum.AAC.1